MSDPIIAETQYGDFKGTVSIDGADKSNLLERLSAKVKMPNGYTPVGFALAALANGRGREGHRYTLTIYAVDADTASGQTIENYAAKAESVPVFGFSTTLELLEVAAIFADSVKRFSLVATSKRLKRKPMVLLDNN